MEKVCLLVDFDDSGLAEDWQEKVYSFDLMLEVNYCTSEEVFPMLSSGGVVGLVIFSQKPRQDIFEVLDEFKKNIGAFPSFQAVVCDEPDPTVTLRLVGIQLLISR